MEIHYWTRSGGKSPVQELILKQVPGLRQRMLKSIEMLQQNGIKLTGEHKILKQMKSAPVLYELKSRSGNLQGRIVLTFVGNEAWLLDAFVKSSPELTDKSIKKSLLRRKDIVV